MSQETDVRILHDREPLLPMARVHAGVHGDGGTPRDRPNEGLDKGDIWVKSHEFARSWYVILRNSCEFVLIDGYGLATSLLGFATFCFGCCLRGVDRQAQGGINVTGRYPGNVLGRGYAAQKTTHNVPKEGGILDFKN